MDQPTISTPGDFIKYARERQRANAEPVRLPSGLVVLAARPGPEWWLRNGRLPQSIAARFAGTPDTAPSSPEDLVKMAEWTVSLISEIMVSPAVSLTPNPDQIHPGLISDNDILFLTRYAGGEISADGQNLDTFPGRRDAGSDAGANGASVVQ